MADNVVPAEGGSTEHTFGVPVSKLSRIDVPTAFGAVVDRKGGKGPGHAPRIPCGAQEEAIHAQCRAS